MKGKVKEMEKRKEEGREMVEKDVMEIRRDRGRKNS